MLLPRQWQASRQIQSNDSRRYRQGNRQSGRSTSGMGQDILFTAEKDAQNDAEVCSFPYILDGELQAYAMWEDIYWNTKTT